MILGHANEAGDAHASAAAEKNAALALGKPIIGRAFGDPDMGGGSEFEPAADHRAMQRDDHRRASELDRLEGAMPHARMERGVEGIARLDDLGKVEAGGKMRALAGEHDGADVRVHASEEGFEPEHGHIVERVALLRAGEAQMGDRADTGRLQRLRQVDVDRFFCCLRRHRLLP